MGMPPLMPPLMIKQPVFDSTIHSQASFDPDRPNSSWKKPLPNNNNNNNENDCQVDESGNDRKRVKAKYDIPTLRIQAGTPLPAQQSPRGEEEEGGGGGGAAAEDNLLLASSFPLSLSQLGEAEKSP